MKKQKIPKELAKKKINNFFVDIKNKEASEVWKIKKLAMKQKISLKENKETFCKKCLRPYQDPKIRIKSGYKTITCETCGAVKRIKL